MNELRASDYCKEARGIDRGQVALLDMDIGICETAWVELEGVLVTRPLLAFGVLWAQWFVCWHVQT